MAFLGRGKLFKKPGADSDSDEDYGQFSSIFYLKFLFKSS